MIIVEADPIFWLVIRKLGPVLSFCAGSLLTLAFLNWKGNR